jgi:hypothetical protein
MGDRNLPRLTIGTLGQGATTPAPTLSIDTIQISIDPRQTLSAGDELIVTASGTPQANANFILANINQNQPIPMNEIRAGVYQGRYTIRRNDGQTNSRLVVYLGKQGLATISRDFNSQIAINTPGTNTGTDNPDQPQRTLKPQILTVQNNEAVSFPLDVRGSTLPNATVRIVGEAINSVGGILSVNEQLYNLSTKAGGRGFFNVQLPQVRALSGNPTYRIRFIATDPQTNQTATTELILRQK